MRPSIYPPPRDRLVSFDGPDGCGPDTAVDDAPRDTIVDPPRDFEQGSRADGL